MTAPLFKVMSFGMAFAVMLGVSACEKQALAPSSRSEIAFAVQPVEKSQDLDKLWAPVMADMQRQTGLKVKPYYTSSYTDLIDAIRFNHVQVALLSSAPGLEAMDRGQGEVFAHTTNPDGSDGYTSVIVVRKESKLTVKDLLKCDRKLNLGMGDVRSTSGTLVPKADLFLPNKVDVGKCFKNLKFAKRDSNIDDIFAGVLDAATTNSDALSELNDTPEGRDKLARLKIIWQSDPLPKGVIEYRADLDPATKEKIRSFFLSYGTGTGPDAERQRANLRAFRLGTLKPSDASYLLPERLLEASIALQEANLSGDKAAIERAQIVIRDVKAEQEAVDAQTAPEAPADGPASQ